MNSAGWNRLQPNPCCPDGVRLQEELRETKGKLEQLEVKISCLSDDLVDLGSNVRTVLGVLVELFPVAFKAKSAEDGISGELFRRDVRALQNDSIVANETDPKSPDYYLSRGATSGPYENLGVLANQANLLADGLSVESPFDGLGVSQFQRGHASVSSPRALDIITPGDQPGLVASNEHFNDVCPVANIKNGGGLTPALPTGPHFTNCRKASLSFYQEVSRRGTDPRGLVKSREIAAKAVRARRASHSTTDILMQAKLQQQTAGECLNRSGQLVRDANPESSKSLRFLTTDL